MNDRISVKFRDKRSDTWLEDFVSQFGNDIRDKVGIGVGEEWHGRD